MNSLDAGECEQRLRDPAARAAFLADGVGGHSFLEPIRAFHAVSAGMQLGVSELYGLDMQPLDLVAALDLLLNGPEAIPDAWIAGGTRSNRRAAPTAAMRPVSGPSAAV